MNKYLTYSIFFLVILIIINLFIFIFIDLYDDVNLNNKTIIYNETLNFPPPPNQYYISEELEYMYEPSNAWDQLYDMGFRKECIQYGNFDINISTLNKGKVEMPFGATVTTKLVTNENNETFMNFKSKGEVCIKYMLVQNVPYFPIDGNVGGD